MRCASVRTSGKSCIVIDADRKCPLAHQMFAAKFPMNRYLADFDFGSSKVDQGSGRQISTMAFTDTAQNAALIGGPGTGKTQLATAISVSVTGC